MVMNENGCVDWNMEYVIQICYDSLPYTSNRVKSVIADMDMIIENNWRHADWACEVLQPKDS